MQSTTFYFKSLCIFCFSFIYAATILPVISQSFQTISNIQVVTDGGNSRGSSWADYDNDGDEDLYIANRNGANFLYRNDGGGVFTKITNSVINTPFQASNGAWGDYDNDGNLDLFVADYGGDNKLFHNNGNGTFTQILTGPVVSGGGNSAGAAWGDYDNDGFIDLYVGNLNQINFLYHNNGNGTFTQITTGSIVTDTKDTHGVVWGDYDNDGFIDLFIANTSQQTNDLYHNNGNGTFTKITTGTIVTETLSSFSGSWGDYNNDGFLDLFVGNHIDSNRDNSLFTNNGDGTFTKVLTGSIVSDNAYSAAATWVDFNNDGYLDIFVINSHTSIANQENLLYINDSIGGFTQVLTGDVVNTGRKSQGLAIADYDLDGYSDIFVGNRDGDNNELYRNQDSINSWVTVKCEGIISNKAALGTKVRVKTTTAFGALWQMREVQSTHGYRSHSSIYPSFGLGSAKSIDSLVIEWPSGLICYYTNLPVDTFYTFQEQCTDPCDTVNISASFTAIANGLSVQLSDFSTGNVNFISYDMGDGNTLSNLAPGSMNTYNYATPGVYTICQYAYFVPSSGDTCVDSSCLPLTLIDIQLDCDTANIQADFSYSTNNLLATFQDLSTGNVDELDWDWGDGNSLNTPPGATPTHTYANSGSYQVCLVATRLFGDSARCKDTLCQTVVLRDTCDQFWAGFKYSTNGLNVTFTDTSYSNTTSSHWSFGDGDTAISNGSGSSVTHTYSFGAGSYAVCLESITEIDSITTCYKTVCDTINITTSNEKLNPVNLVKVFPNPTAGNLLINRLSVSTQPISVSIRDLRGREVFPEKEYRGEKIELDIRQLSQGTYILEVKERQSTQFLRIIKTR